MRLTNIKISGFKSFVDKTEIILTKNITGVIGPNGCGKSNVVDAVKWVLGETSKHIRGDNIDDVIFYGTDTRKPNDYAYVELLFLNTENKIGGQYAQYDEISIKREVARDGVSKYFLNNSHCRRRDILDIFLGTGLGPKSYAIINQGMATRLIESKPEEFRAYLEEVAGISKYRERKRETEIKIKNTKENLERLNDVVSEVLKQLRMLERQAIEADRYKKLLEEKKIIKKEILAIYIRDYQENIEDKNKKIEVKKTQLEKRQSEINKINLELEKLKRQYQEFNEELNETQKQYYDALSEAGKIEQTIEYEKEGAERGKQQYENIISSIDKIKLRLNQDSENLEIYKKDILSIENKKNDCIRTQSEIESVKNKLNNTLSSKKKELEDSDKKIYELTQEIKSKNEKIDLSKNEVIRIQKDINENIETSKKISIELKNIESYELEKKIINFNNDVANFIDESNSNSELKIKAILKNIKNTLDTISKVVQKIQSNEYDFAVKNEQIKNDIDKKIGSEKHRLDLIKQELHDIENFLIKSTSEIDNLNKYNASIRETITNINKEIDEVTQKYNTLINDLHNYDINTEKNKIQILNLESNILLNSQELESMTGHIKLLENNSNNPKIKLTELEENLLIKLEIQSAKEEKLKEIRIKINGLTNNISSYESHKNEVLTILENIKLEIYDDQKNVQEIIGQVKNINEQLLEIDEHNNFKLDINIDYSLIEWKKKEAELLNAIEKMGAVNMTASEQYNEYDERRSYLIMQKEDLFGALDLLEKAIFKIDKETKEKFNETFNAVNSNLQEIFPKLFNGGKAYLKMTEADLLKTGIEVVASPPGKKITSINLLSGGEKALTAISLVFALFLLNPSPFCMLDEIDAPLDDVNIEKFCNLFVEMSKHTQFIIITHDKITMEYCEHLIGVTMGEKGVSKLVNVSI